MRILFSLFALSLCFKNAAQASSIAHDDRSWIRGPAAGKPLSLVSGSSRLSVVLWHGMGDTCCNSESIGYVADYIAKRYGVYVHSLNTGSGSPFSDFLSGFYGSVNDQIARACAQLRADEQLRRGFSIIGFSQGGQFARALAQRCAHLGLRVRSLITFGGQHGGIVDVPGCSSASMNETEAGICKAAMQALGLGSTLPFVRDHIVQAQYFKDPYQLERYYELNPFLPDANNEVPARRKSQYRTNLLQLDWFVMVRFQDDSTVVPRDSAWFSWFDGEKLIPLKEQAQYTEDWLGLQTLDRSKRLIFEEMPGQHMHIAMPVFDRLLDQYLATDDKAVK